MYQVFLIVILSLNVLISSLHAHSEYLAESDFQMIIPSVRIVHLDDHDECQSSAQLLNTISQMLRAAKYDHDAKEISLHKSQKNQIAIVETKFGKKFVKIKKRGEGLNEYLGTLFFNDFAPIIPTETLILSQKRELVVQPFIPAAEDNLLFQKISELEKEDCSATWALMNSIFDDALNLSKSTLHYSVGNAKNEDFFFNRLKTQDQDGISGRIERIYKGKLFKLMDVEISWEEFKTLHWSVDGICYQETLAELLANARHHLDLNQLRLLGISHGNWHENNIIVNQTDSELSPAKYAYFALEFAGQNDLIADAIMFLTHTTIYADYLNPVYYSQAYGNNKMEEEALKNTKLLKAREIKVNKEANKVNIVDVGSFGTLKSRQKIAHLFHEKYFCPLVKYAIGLFGQDMSNYIENHSKAALLLRLLGGQDVSRMTAQDQAKILGLIYRSIGTPITGHVDEAAINRFIQAL